MLGTNFQIPTLAVRRNTTTSQVAFSFTGPSLPAGVSFSRASTGRRFGPGSNIETLGPDTPRFDHDPQTGSPRGLLIETSATNLYPASANIGNSTANLGATGPTFHASLRGLDFYEINAPGTGYVQLGGINISGLLVGEVATQSIYVISAGGTQFEFWQAVGTTGMGRVRYQVDLSTETTTLLSNVDNVFTDCGVDNLGAGLYRVWLTGEKISADTIELIRMTNSNGALYVAAPQFEAGGYATSYVETSGGQATRAADQPTIDTMSGSFDIRITYDDGSFDDLLGVSVSPGWWPALSEDHVVSIVFYPPGQLA